MPTCVESREKLEKQSSMMVSTETQSHDRDGTASLESFTHVLFEDLEYMF